MFNVKLKKTVTSYLHYKIIKFSTLIFADINSGK